MSFSEWKEYKLEDVTINYNSKRVPLSSKERELRQGKFPYYGAQGVIDFIDKFIFEGQYLLVAEDGANLETRNEDIARLTKNQEQFWVNNHAHILRSNENSDIRYIKYFLNKSDLSGYITGSAQPKLNKANLNSIRMVLPPFEEQKAIAHILSTLDDKIEVNNQINRTLENMAQTIFKQWFVDFEFPNEDGEPYKSSGGEMIESELGMIPKGWEVRTVDDITAKFTTGLNPRKNFVLGNGNNFYVTIKNMGNQQVFLDDRCDKIDDQALVIINKRSDLRKGDVLFSGIGTIGRTYLIDTIPKNWNISESIFTLRAYDERVSLFLYQLLLSESFQGYAKQLASGSVQKGIRMGDMKIFKLAYSESVVINNYHKIMSSVIDKIKVLQRENIMLSNLRETLLPKLMSEEIRVPLDEEGDVS